MAGDELDAETIHLMELYNTLEQRRRLYEQQKAILWPLVPPDVSLGLAQTLREIDAVQGQLRLPPIGAEVEEAIPDAPAKATEWRMRQLDRDVRTLLGGILDTVNAGRDDTATWRTQQEGRWEEQGKWRTQQEARWTEQDTARQRGNRRTLGLLIVFALFQLGGLLIIVWIAATLRAHGL